jgi:hypothetical protein
MKKSALACIISFFFCTLLVGCQSTESISTKQTVQPSAVQTVSVFDRQKKYPKIASWLAKKDEIIASRKPYDLIMSGWFTPEEASQIKSVNPDAGLLAGLTVNWIWDNPDWLSFLTTIASYGREKPYTINENMYLRKPDGSRCAFGWASEKWEQEEIYAMDPRNPEWRALITSFYQNVLDQPQHDGIIVDMMLEKSLFPDAISDEEWVQSTRDILSDIKVLNTTGKAVIFNAGRDFSEIDAYSDFMTGFLMENFLGEQLKISFTNGLKAAESGYPVIYAVDTDDSGIRNMNRMRLGLVLSLLNDNTYFTYDFGPRDHGQAWWFPEYDVNLGEPLGNYYLKERAYYRDFERGIVVASPDSATMVTFDTEHFDISSGEKAASFSIQKGDGRIFLLE